MPGTQRSSTIKLLSDRPAHAEPGEGQSQALELLQRPRLKAKRKEIANSEKAVIARKELVEASPLRRILGNREDVDERNRSEVALKRIQDGREIASTRPSPALEILPSPPSEEQAEQYVPGFQLWIGADEFWVAVNGGEPVLVGVKPKVCRGMYHTLKRHPHDNVLKVLDLLGDADGKKAFWVAFEYAPIDLTHIFASPYTLGRKQIKCLVHQVRYARYVTTLLRENRSCLP